jgi:hypothetical protein
MTRVEEFRDWWIAKGKPWRIPFDKPIHVTDIAYALCLYREKKFQVELYICKKNTQSPFHTHPNVESVSMYLSGDLAFSKDDGSFYELSEYQKEKENGAHFLFGKSIEINDGNKPHALKIGNTGGAFLIFEHWKNGTPTSVTTNWQGDLTGKIHAKTIGENHVV